MAASWRTLKRGLACGIAVLAFGTSCVHKPPTYLSREPQTLLDEVRSSQDQVKRVKGKARVNLQSPRANGSASQWIAAEKPDRLHIETLDFFGNVAVVLVADGRSFSLYDARTATFYRGEPTPENVSRLLPMVFSASELVTMLCGSAPLLPGAPQMVREQDALLQIDVLAGQKTQRLEIGERAAVERASVRRRAIGADGTNEPSIYELEFSHFRSLGGRFPVEARLAAPQQKSRVELTWSDVELNGVVDEGLFRLTPPKGAKVVELSAGSSAPEVSLPLRPPGEK